jgi:hypothetical protein
MQPAQLSLLPDQLPAPPEALLDQLPVPQVEAAMTLLAHLIAKTAQPTPPSTVTAVTAGSEDGGE